MRTVVADSGPLRYLVLIGEVAILPKVVGDVLIPPEVRAELDQPQTPAPVRTWIGAPPPWLEIRPVHRDRPGAIGADALLMDDRAGVVAALAKDLVVIGTLGVLDRAARRGLIDLAAALTRLRATNFRYPPALLDTLLAEDRARRETR